MVDVSQRGVPMRRNVVFRLLTVAAVGVVFAGFAAVTRIASAEESLTARFDWTMPERVVMDPTAPASVDNLTPTREFLLQPNGWEVKLSACASFNRDHPTARYAWKVTVDVGQVLEQSSTGCEATFVVPEQGRYPVELTLTDVHGHVSTATGPIDVRDILIVSLGDSVASGEGNPDHVAFGGQSGGWDNRQCHRSGLSGPAQAARRLEQADPHTSVTFLSLACSGASIVKGILEPYEGQEIHPGDADLEPQIVVANRLLCETSENGCANPKETRRMDALMLQAGANDLHFGTIVEECGYPRFFGVFEPCDSNDETILRLFNDLRELPGRYSELARRLDAELNYREIHFPQYFDVTSANDGRACPSMDFITDDGPNGLMTNAEVKFAYQEVILPLNSAVREAGIEANNNGHRWNMLDQIMIKFVQHGYCADDHWITRYDESVRRQGNETGTMHPNGKGQEIYTNALFDAIQPLLTAKRPPIVFPPIEGEPSIRGRK
jgi:hypothetical protein